MSESPLIASLPTSSAVTASTGLADDGVLGDRTTQRRRAEPEQSDPATGNPVVVVELHRDRGARDGEIAVAAGELLDREAGPAAPHREPHRRQDLVGCQRCLPQAGEEVRRRDLPAAPRDDVASIVASSASATAAYSAAGSACAIAPPSVPRVRIWKCPM